MFLAASVFTDDFARALAVFLHEHAHIYGYDGSRAFTDALTELIEATIRHRQALDTYDNDWQTAREHILAERGKSITETEQPMNEQLRGMDRADSDEENRSFRAEDDQNIAERRW